MELIEEFGCVWTVVVRAEGEGGENGNGTVAGRPASDVGGKRRGKGSEMIRSFLQMRRSHDNDYIYKSLRLLIARLYIETGVYSPFRVVNVAPNAHCGLIQPHTRRDEARTCINGSICGRSYRRARRIWLHGYDVGHRPPPRPASLFVRHPLSLLPASTLSQPQSYAHIVVTGSLFYSNPPAYTLLLSP